MCEYKSDYATQNQIQKTIVEEKGIKVDFKEVERKLAETKFGYVAVFCRNVGIPGSWEIVIADDDKRQLRKVKEEPAELVFIIRSDSLFARSKIKQSFGSRSGYTGRRAQLLCKVF
jgi:hypothetical protein